jgi:hypothetical protein
LEKRWAPPLASVVVYALVTVILGREVLSQLDTSIVHDQGDPLLTAAILHWNARSIPFTDAWWQFPIFYPTRDALTFSEHLLGLSVISAPIDWLTGDALVAYNLATLLTFPLCAAAMYALTYHLTGSAGGAFIAGLAFGFGPYRITHLPHVQVLAVFWAPLALLGLHAFLESGRRRWLVLYGVAWMLQVAANAYCLFFFSILVGLWGLWFVVARRNWRALGMIAAATAIASVPLIPIFYKYVTVHAFHGFERPLDEIRLYGADVAAVLCAPSDLTFWGWVRVACRVEGELFPGLALMSLCLAAPFVMRARGAGAPGRPVGFYLFAALITWLLALGPTITFMGGSTGIDGPFMWLLALPGATGLRVPARFWLMTVLCLTTVAGIVVAELLKGRRFATRAVVIAAVALAVLGDGWVNGMTTQTMSRLGPVPPVLAGQVVIALPFGDPVEDVAAEWRAITRGWMSVNGYSSYRPAHYESLRDGLELRDGAILTVLRKLDTLYIDVPSNNAYGLRAWLTSTYDDEWLAGEASGHAWYRLTKLPDDPPVRLGPPLPFGVLSASCSAATAMLILDGAPETRWVCGTATPGQQIVVDLAEVHTVSGIGHTLGRFKNDLPRSLRVDVSLDGTTWRTVWSGLTAAYALRAALDDPNRMELLLECEPTAARYVRLMQTDERTDRAWSIAELRVFGG